MPHPVARRPDARPGSAWTADLAWAFAQTSRVAAQAPCRSCIHRHRPSRVKRLTQNTARRATARA
jgi:hypothetical protein